jgi:hypothetical protein
MRSKNNLPVFGISDICVPLKAEVFSLFRHEQQGKASLPQAHKHNFYMLFSDTSYFSRFFRRYTGQPPANAVMLKRWSLC